ncbi:hypothetical protein PRIPAC_74227 [Pristionchus pacificus]|uniref:Uncharacterized protein n=1 Tax=Pristionchus pacificus TaxID=54126 RepID=A0A2A6BFG3_PRIPA|nr:hypothetical protein PRIPAC_74227 [Pristionchus pacificus]|eukprot:PDM64620.1 hypothetical protein PRIPAC_52876 [Pristionchus pacificus]
MRSFRYVTYWIIIAFDHQEPPNDDKLVVEWAEVPHEETDPKAPFAAQAQQGEVILPLKAA